MAAEEGEGLSPSAAAGVGKRPRRVGGDGHGCVASGKPWGNSQLSMLSSGLSVLSSGLDGGGESIEKARSKLEKFRGFLLAGFC